jgi:hypothetical protein
MTGRGTHQVNVTRGRIGRALAARGVKPCFLRSFVAFEIFVFVSYSLLRAGLRASFAAYDYLSALFQREPHKTPKFCAEELQQYEYSPPQHGLLHHWHEPLLAESQPLNMFGAWWRFQSQRKPTRGTEQVGGTAPGLGFREDTDLGKGPGVSRPPGSFVLILAMGTRLRRLHGYCEIGAR